MYGDKQTAKQETDQTVGYETKWAAEKETWKQNRQQKRNLQSAAMKENKLKKRRHRDRTEAKEILTFQQNMRHKRRQTEDNIGD